MLYDYTPVYEVRIQYINVFKRYRTEHHISYVRNVPNVRIMATLYPLPLKWNGHKKVSMIREYHNNTLQNKYK